MIKKTQRTARSAGRSQHRPQWPMIILRSPKGWTGPASLDGVPIEGTFRSHQVPIRDVRQNHDHLRLLETWLRSYRPGQLFDGAGRPTPLVLQANPEPKRQLSESSAEHGTTTTPFDMVVQNQVSRYHLVMDAIGHAHRLPTGAAEVVAWSENQLSRHASWIRADLEDLPEIRSWTPAHLRRP